MDKLPPIPSPPGTAWREFRINALPALVFLGVLSLTVLSWRNYVGPSSLVGEVEAVRAIVSSALPGRVTQLKVGHLQRVTAGEDLVQVITTDPKILDAQLGLIKARIDFARVAVEPKLRKDNNRINFLQVRLDWLRQRVELASVRAQLSFYEAEYARLKRLHTDNTDNSSIVSLTELQIAQRDLDVTRAQITEHTRLVTEIEEAMKSLEPDEAKIEEELPSSVRAAMAIEEGELKLIEAQLAPVTLTAPIDGFISFVHRRSGEAIIAGEPILTISGAQSERITAYLRQPLGLEPHVGMFVEVRARSFGRPTGRGEVLSVGAQLEPIPPQLLPQAMRAGGGSNSFEFGLPILVSLPDGMKALGGEMVDLRPLRE